MSQNLSATQKQQLSKWIGDGKKKKFTSLYRISVDGCNATTFHQKCDGKGPTLTVAYNTSGYIYGGYTNQSWTSDGQYKNDPKAFLFSLGTTVTPTKYPIGGTGTGNSAIYGHLGYGPTFGGGHDIMFFSGSINGTSGVYKLNQTASFGHSYTTNGHNINNLTGGVTTVTDLAVYSVTDGEECLEEAWRKTPEWNEKLMESLKDAVESYRPYDGLKLKHVQILLIGPVGSGKSSFINTINSIFRGRISSQAPTGSVEHSLTNQYRKYRVLVGDAGKPTSFRFCDTMGLEEGQGIDSSDIPFLLDGNVPNRYKFNPATHVTSDIPNFKKSPTLEDKIQCVGFVLDSTIIDTISEKMMLKIQSIRQHINQRTIPIVVLLTKVDKVCPMVFEDVSVTFKSEGVRDMVNQTAELVGVPRSHVLPVKNYESEIELDPNISILALLALRQMLWFADDFLCNEVEVLQEEGS